MIRSLEIKRYRSIESLNLDLDGVRILIGQNAAGKSNILDALAFIHDAVHADLGFAVSSRGGLDGLIYLGAPAERRSAEISMEYVGPDPERQNGPSEFRYQIVVDERAENPAVASEHLTSVKDHRVWLNTIRGRGEARRVEPHGAREYLNMANPRVLALTALGFLDTYPAITWLRTVIESWMFLNVNVAQIREPRRELVENVLFPDAANLANVLRSLQPANPDRFRSILEDVRSLLERVESISTEVDGGLVLLQLQERGLPHALDALSLSDGTLRLLAIVTALETMPDPGLLCIEEPEIGLHPLLFGPLLELIRERCPEGGSRQALMTTHSPDLVDAAEPGEVVPVERDEHGATIIRPLDARQVREWIKDFRLGELWKMRQIGGVP